MHLQSDNDVVPKPIGLIALTEYYFDIETSRTGVIAFAFQEIQHYAPVGGLQIWLIRTASDEKIMLKGVQDLGVLDWREERRWRFVPVGTNLRYDFTVLIDRMTATGVRRWTPREILALFEEKPRKDIHDTLVLMNDGEFKGSGLDTFTTLKTVSSKEVPKMWDRRDLPSIEKYIRDDAAAFFDVYGKLGPALSALGKKIRPRR